MKVSVIVPVYNCAPYVERCVKSIMEQTYSNLEIICVNDGSTDCSGKILDELAREDDRILVIHQKNAGVSAARNAGIKAATGNFITFVDSDDAIEHDMYETLLPYFADESIDIVHCGYKRISPDGSVKDVNGTARVVEQNKYEAAGCLLTGRLFVGSLCNKIYRAHLFSEVSMDETLVINEDVLANAELFRKSEKIVYIDIGKYLMYQREGSATTGTKQQKILTDCLNAAEKMLSLYKQTPAEQEAEERLLNTQIGFYRWYVMNTFSDNRQECRKLANKIKITLKKRKDISKRQRVNYAFMRHMPALYKIMYTIYDKVRVPNWDVRA